MNIDAIIVGAYFIVVLIVSLALTQKYKKASTDDFLTGGNHLNWFQTAMTLIAMMFDPGIMGISALAFVWGFYVIQWNAVNIWVTSWFAGMFIVGIYWRSKITTTPEYLEKRFNVVARSFFSLIMVAMLVSLLAYAVYMGSILLNNSLGWNLWLNIVLISSVAGIYVVFGGVRTMLTMDVFQAVLLLVALIAVGVAGFNFVGGFEGIRAFNQVGDGGTPLKSFIPPMDFMWNSKTYFPLPAIPTFAVIAGLSWIICNFSMAQRLLAAKNELHAQKALIMAGVFNVFVLLLAYTAGVAVRKMIADGLLPDVAPDEAFITLLLHKFPVGVRGILIVGLIAALLSTIDGLISSSATLLTQDIFVRFFRKDATKKQIKVVLMIFEGLVIASIFLIIPVFLSSDGEVGSTPAYEIIQKFLGDVFGVLIAIYLLGIFFKRTTSNGVLIAMAVGTALGFYLDIATDMNFALVGSIQFTVVMILGIVLSWFQPAPDMARLQNLTIWTLSDVSGPWIGLKSWPGLVRWAIGLPLTWFTITAIWEWYMSN